MKALYRVTIVTGAFATVATLSSQAVNAGYLSRTGPVRLRFEHVVHVEPAVVLPALDMGDRPEPINTLLSTNEVQVAAVAEPLSAQAPDAIATGSTNSIWTNLPPVAPEAAEPFMAAPQTYLRFFPVTGRTNAELMVVAPVFTPPQPSTRSSQATYESK